VTLSIVDGEALGIGHNVNHTAMALHVDDVGAARAALEERGVPFQGDILGTGVRHMAFWLTRTAMRRCSTTATRRE
jgi:hypothetical protein